MNLPGKYIEKKTLYYFFGTLSRFTRNSRVCVCVCVCGEYHNVAEYPNKFYRFKIEKKSVLYNCKNVPSKHETQDLTQSSFCAYWLIALCHACVSPSFSPFLLFLQRKALTLNLTSRRYLLSLFFLTSSPCICKRKKFCLWPPNQSYLLKDLYHVCEKCTCRLEVASQRDCRVQWFCFASLGF